MPSVRFRRTSVRVVVGVLAAGALFGVAAPASAHYDLVATDPADRAWVEPPIERVELTFSGPVEPVRSGVRLLTSDGDTIDATVFQPSDEIIVVEPDTALSDGRVAVLWEVISPDDHVTSGGFSFTVAGPTATSTTTVAPTDADAASGPVPQVTTTTAAPRVLSTTAAPQVDAIVFDVPAGSPAADWLGRVGRWLTMTGALLGLGALAFAGTAMRGTSGEVRRAVRWVRRGGVLVLVGTACEVAALALATADGIAAAFSPIHLIDVLGVGTGFAVVLRVVGGIAMLQDPRLVEVVDRPASAPGTVPADGAGAVAVADRVAVADASLAVGGQWVALAGVVAVATSFMLTGHAASGGLVARIATGVHVAAAGVWFGGLVVMADTLARRRRGRLPLRGREMAVRFSRIASVALGLVTLAGVALAWSIVDEPSDLATGAWGRILIAKLALVAVVVGLGTYNHFRVVPSLDRHPADPHVNAVLARTTAVEAWILVGVLAVTAVLVATAP